MTARLKLLPTTSPALAELLQEGRLVIEPELARQVLAEANYSRQRALSQGNVHKFREQIRNGEWLDTGSIQFVRLDGKLFLVDGQHRLHAIADVDQAMPLVVLISEVKTEAELHLRYSRIDAPDHAPRSTRAGLDAYDPIAEFELSKELRQACQAAMGILANRFPHRRLAVVEKALPTREAHNKMLTGWGAEAAAYDAILRDGTQNLRRPLRSPGVVAVALATLRHFPKRAPTFWRQVAENNLLSAGDPEQALVNFLLVSDLGARAHAAERGAATAWNAWFAGRKLASIRLSPDSLPIKIAGTPYQGRD